MRNHFGIVQPLLTDFYQLTMAYAYWKTGKMNECAVFEAFFRKNPFGGEFTIFAGISDCVSHIQTFKFSTEDIDYLKKSMPSSVDPAFFEYLLSLDASQIELWSAEEGSAVFPREPILRIEGPIVICQLLETTLLNLINFACLVTTNAARFRIAAGADKKLVEFGLRRAQGPDGGLMASRYAYLGGFDASSNVLAGKLFQIPIAGTHAHSFISAYEPRDAVKSEGCLCSGNRISESDLSGDRSDTEDPLMNEENGAAKKVENASLLDFTAEPITANRLFKRSVYWSKQLSKILNYPADQVHLGELTAFAKYAFTFPDAFIGLIDTYGVLDSGLPNFCAVSLALYEFGHKAVGLRIDSGDLAFLSRMVRQAFHTISTHFDLPWFRDLKIMVSNDLNEDTLYSLNQQSTSGHSIDTFCVGTNLVTCQKQPALGCVYKLVEISGRPTMKISAVADKVNLPGRKTVYRLYGKQGNALLDLMRKSDEPAPMINERILCRHPNDPSKRVYVIPSRVEETLKLFWQNGKSVRPISSLNESRSLVQAELKTLRSDYKRFLNPTPYKVSVSEDLYQFTQSLWLNTVPIGELF